MDEMKNTNASIESEDVVKPGLSSSRFVKVFMQGEVVGRKINLDVHKNYASLSFTLKRLANNYSMPSTELNGLVNNEEGGVLDDDNFIIFYDNMDGDRFFLGEVPWELFIISVKRIYIVPVEQENDNEDDEEEEDGENGDGNDATSAAPVDGDDAPANDDGVVDDEDDVVDVSADDGAGEE